MSIAEQLIYQTEKSSHPRFSIKMLFLKILQYSQENTCVNILRISILKNICIRLLLNRLYEVIVRKFVSRLHLLDPVILQKYHLFLSQSFKQNLAHMPSMYLTPTLSCETRFCMFIINGF